MDSEETSHGWEDQMFEEWRERKLFPEECDENEASEMEMQNL